MTEFISAKWPAPKNIKTLVTTRKGGVSAQPWNHLNLATHVNDNPLDVAENRIMLKQQAKLPSEPEWLNQSHSIEAINLDKDSNREADASYATMINKIATVLTADCLPLLVCNKAGTEVAAIHAGWPGLVKGIIKQSIESMHSKPNDLMVWVGPAISQKNYEVGEEVRQAFCKQNPKAESHFIIKKQNKYLADLPSLAKQQLNQLGIDQIFLSNWCSYDLEDQFFSYRRDGLTGRMASMIWIT